ncbi:uncharacterized protein [Argopecten irradians]|uniref:uncharacterized protein n=1 Tax=Argopecten irradians TaxID=31199 RepID=UPI003715A7F8
MFSCGLCSNTYRFRARYLAKRHMLEQHSGFAWQCQGCKGLFNRSTSKHACSKDGRLPPMVLVRRSNMESGQKVEEEYNSFLRSTSSLITTVSGEKDQSKANRSISHQKTMKRKIEDSRKVQIDTKLKEFKIPKMTQGMQEKERQEVERLESEERERAKEQLEREQQEKEEERLEKERQEKERQEEERLKSKEHEKAKEEKLEREKREKEEERQEKKEQEDREERKERPQDG